jgi:hypothetical protein
LRIDFWVFVANILTSFYLVFGEKSAQYCAFAIATPSYKSMAAYKAIKSRVSGYKTVKLHNTFKRLAIFP